MLAECTDLLTSLASPKLCYLPLRESIVRIPSPWVVCIRCRLLTLHSQRQVHSLGTYEHSKRAHPNLKRDCQIRGTDTLS